MKLTEDQKAFLQKHVTGLSRQEKKKKTSAYTDYLRRAGKVKALLDKLKGSDTYNDVLFIYADAEDKAKQGYFEDAYSQLEQAKNLAGSAAKGYVDSLTYNTLHERIIKLREVATDAMIDTDAVVASVKTSRKRIGDDPALASPKGALKDDPSLENRERLLNDFLACSREIALALQAAPIAAQEAADQLARVDFAGEMEGVRRQVEVAQKYGNKKQKQSLDGLIVLLDDVKDIASIDGQLATPAYLMRYVREAVAAAQDELDKKCKTWRSDFGPRDFSDEDTTGKEGGGPVTRITGTDSKTSLEDAEEAYAKSLELAKIRYLEDIERDKKLLNTKDELIPTPKQLPTYKTTDGLSGAQLERLRGLAPPPEGIDKEPAPPINDEEIEAAALAAAEHVGKTLAEQDPGSDVVFDLLLKNKKMFMAELARELGWDKDPKKWTEDQTKAANRIAEAMASRVSKDCPNKLSDDRKTVKLNNKTYKDPKQLGKGGMCTAVRYTCEEDKSTIVVKSPNASQWGMSEGQRDGMVGEMRSHRLAMGGEGGKGNEHLVGLLGGLTYAKGGLHMVLEDCPGGDLDGFATGMNQALESGALPPDVRDMLIRQIMMESSKGVKFLKDQGLTHNDIKGANFLIDSKGTIKIADLGSTRVVNEEGQTQPNEGEKEIPQTPLFAPPEGPVSGKSDIFILGGVLDVLKRPNYTEGVTVFKGNDKRQTGHEQTAFDRLHNAMLDKDPEKRPTIESVLMSSYLEDVMSEGPKEPSSLYSNAPKKEIGEVDDEPEPEPDPVTELKQAIIAFGSCKAVRDLDKEQSRLDSNLVDLERARDHRQGLDVKVKKMLEEQGQIDGPTQNSIDISDIRIRGLEKAVKEGKERIAELEKDPERLQLLKLIENAAKQGSRNPRDKRGEQAPGKPKRKVEEVN
jgi:serine/threonine protein kinase